jgi:N-succinyldiaminopimelate aminotransferase
VLACLRAVFYDDHPDEGRTLVRFAFCKRPEVLKDAVGRLSALAR